MTEPQRENRAARRFALDVPLSVNYGRIIRGDAQVRDVSAHGISFYLGSELAQGSLIEFTLTLPPEVTLAESIRVQCKGHVLRVEDLKESGTRMVAAVIEEYEFLPANKEDSELK